MEVEEARSVLGVTAADGWEAVRAASRRKIRGAHPDTQGAASTPAATRVNQAYAALSRAKRAGLLHAPVGAPPGPAAAPAPPPPPAPPPVGLAVVGGDTLLLAAPPDEAFALLLEA